MGLDIYFYKTKKSGNTIKECYETANNEKKAEFREWMVNAIERLKQADKTGEYNKVYNELFLFPSEISKFFAYDYDYGNLLKGVQPLNVVKATLNKIADWVYVLYAAYFRKANFIYAFFNDKLENEACFVTKDDLNDLIDRCNKVLENNELAKELLPTTSGFFFGSTDYDEYYFDDVRDCRRQLTALRDDFDESNEVCFVLMDW